MAATGTAAARAESVPAGSAAVSEKFRRITRRAKPAVRRFRLPFAQGTADPAKVGKHRVLIGLLPG